MFVHPFMIGLGHYFRVNFLVAYKGLWCMRQNNGALDIL